MGVGSVGEIRSQQQEIVTEQDEGLESLSRGLRSQQRMGLAMQDEVQDQNGISYNCVSKFNGAWVVDQSCIISNPGCQCSHPKPRPPLYCADVIIIYPQLVFACQ